MKRLGSAKCLAGIAAVLGLMAGGFGCNSNQGANNEVAESAPAATSGAQGANSVAPPAGATAAQPDDAVIGKWVVTEAAKKNDIGVTFNFQEGGNCILTKQGSTDTISTRYTLKGSQLDMKVSKPSAQGKAAETESVIVGTVTVTGDEMTIDVKSSAFSQPQLLKLKRA